MRLASFSLWLGCLASSTLAFSSLPKPANFGRAVSRGNAQKSQVLTSSALGVASADSIPVADMERGVGGRIEAAFEAAKKKGEAAFVTFITAGYPNAQGRMIGDLQKKLIFSSEWNRLTETISPLPSDSSRYTCVIDGHAGRWCLCY